MPLNKSEALERLNRQISDIPNLRSMGLDSVQFKKWQRDTQVLLTQIFGDGSSQSTEFSGISWTPTAFVIGDHQAFDGAYTRGLETAQAMLSSMVDEIEEFWSAADDTTPPDAITIIRLLCTRFHLVARQLRNRYQDRPTIEIEDEYDVQDLMHALLKLHFDDVRAEEWTPSYAGKSSRMDFLLKNEKVVFEIKNTRKGLDHKNVGDQLAIDIVRYKSHPDCSTLVCFVYDPEGRIGNPASLESDLTGNEHGLDVLVVVAPKGT